MLITVQQNPSWQLSLAQLSPSLFFTQAIPKGAQAPKKTLMLWIHTLCKKIFLIHFSKHFCYTLYIYGKIAKSFVFRCK